MFAPVPSLTFRSITPLSFPYVLCLLSLTSPFSPLHFYFQSVTHSFHLLASSLILSSLFIYFRLPHPTFLLFDSPFSLNLAVPLGLFPRRSHAAVLLCGRSLH